MPPPLVCVCGGGGGVGGWVGVIINSVPLENMHMLVHTHMYTLRMHVHHLMYVLCFHRSINVITAYVFSNDQNLCI